MPRFYSPRDFPETGFGSATKGFLGGLQLGQELRLNEQRDRRREELAQAQAQRWENEYAQASLKNELLKGKLLEKAQDDEMLRQGWMEKIEREAQMNPMEQRLQRLKEQTSLMKNPDAIKQAWSLWEQDEKEIATQEGIQNAGVAFQKAAEEGVLGNLSPEDVQAEMSLLESGQKDPDEMMEEIMSARLKQGKALKVEERWQNEALPQLQQILDTTPEGEQKDKLEAVIGMYSDPEQPSMRLKDDPGKVVKDAQTLALQAIGSDSDEILRHDEHTWENMIQEQQRQPGFEPYQKPGQSEQPDEPLKYGTPAFAEYTEKKGKEKEERLGGKGKSFPKLEEGSQEAAVFQKTMEQLAAIGGTRKEYKELIDESDYSPEDPLIQKIMNEIIDAYAGTDK